VLPAGYAASTVPFARFILTISGASISGLGRISDSLGIAPDFSKFYSAPSAGGCQSNDPQDFCGAPNSPLDLDITISNIPVNDLVIGITAGLSVVSRGSGASADAMDPGQLSILLPDGFSFTSASGVLLTQAVTAPEPSSLPLFAGFLGLAALAGVGQARRGVAARLSLAWRRISA
jgi:hypothetical protein